MVGLGPLTVPGSPAAPLSPAHPKRRRIVENYGAVLIAAVAQRTGPLHNHSESKNL